ncbi:MAG: sigma 54-interacting transcriptional regulator [Acidobacteria bacterium]|nr:sigma 54-interacting transcriptional regulator [Acidobacteriota bacterium]
MDSILVVYGNPEMRRQIEALLTGDGYHVTSTDSPASAAEFVRTERFHLVLFDSGLNASPLERAAAPPPMLRLAPDGKAPEVPGVTLATPDSLRAQVARAIAMSRFEQECQVLRDDERRRYAPGIVIARSARMIAILDKVREYAALPAPVWISGEAGTGKRSLALLLHAQSTRASGPFIRLTPGADRESRFLAADSGTLYVEDGESLSLPHQASLLQIIQERSFRREACGQVAHTNARVVVASSGSLDAGVRAGLFRSELLASLLPCIVEVPPLRERHEDIAPLAEHFLHTAAARLGRPVPRLSEAAGEALSGYSWPGNAVELEVVMTRAVLAATGFVEIPHLAIDGPHAPLRLSSLERGAIEKALMLTRDNRTQAAALLGISVRTLQYRLKEYGIKWDGPRPKSNTAAGKP